MPDPKAMMKLKTLVDQLSNLVEEMSSGAMPEGDDAMTEAPGGPDDSGGDAMKSMKMKMMAQKTGF